MASPGRKHPNLAFLGTRFTSLSKKWEMFIIWIKMHPFTTVQVILICEFIPPPPFWGPHFDFLDIGSGSHPPSSAYFENSDTLPISKSQTLPLINGIPLTENFKKV